MTTKEKKLYNLANKLHGVIDSVTSSMHEMGMKEDPWYLELAGELAESETTLKEFEDDDTASNKYILFGEEVIHLLDDGTFIGFLRRLKEDDGYDYELIEITNETTIADVLQTAMGYQDYAILTNQEAQLIINL